jgi:primosomal protein N' (replication factor Y)
LKIGVAVDTGSSGSVDVLTYEVPYGLVDQVEAGTCILVPLGSRQIVGYVIGPDPNSPITNLKEIISIVDIPARLDQDLVDLAKWVSNEYFCSYFKTQGLRIIIR